MLYKIEMRIGEEFGQQFLLFALTSNISLFGTTSKFNTHLHTFHNHSSRKNNVITPYPFLQKYTVPPPPKKKKKKKKKIILLQCLVS
jgi:hypothetical protein